MNIKILGWSVATILMTALVVIFALYGKEWLDAKPWRKNNDSTSSGSAT